MLGVGVGVVGRATIEVKVRVNNRDTSVSPLLPSKPGMCAEVLTLTEKKKKSNGTLCDVSLSLAPNPCGKKGCPW